MEDITITISCCEETGMLVAHWDDPQGRGGLTTQAERLSDLETNIRDAVEVHFEPSELPSRIRLHFENDPVLAAARNCQGVCRAPTSFARSNGRGSPS